MHGLQWRSQKAAGHRIADHRDQMVEFGQIGDQPAQRRMVVRIARHGLHISPSAAAASSTLT